MKKLLLIALTLISSQALAATRGLTREQIEQQNKGWLDRMKQTDEEKRGEEESIFQSLSKAPIFLKLKNQLSEQFPGLFDSIAAGDVSGFLKIFGSNLQNIISGSFQNLTPAIQDIKPTNITLEDLRTLKKALDNYASGLYGSEEVNPKLREIFGAAKETYKKLVTAEKSFSTAAGKNFPIHHYAQEYLKNLIYGIVEGDTAAQEITPAYPNVSELPKAPASQNTVLDAIGKYLGF